MSQMKWLPVIMITALVGLTANAEPSRTFYSLENQFPRWEQLEVGLTAEVSEQSIGRSDVDVTETSVYARYGLLDDLAVFVDIPILEVDPDFGDSETGLGDIELGFQLRAYEDIFEYPYFLPYVTMSLPTGDEDDGLGAGDPVYRGGISYGSTIHDWIDWVLDVSYQINPDDNNQLIVGHSYVWNLSDSFAILTEFLYREAELDLLDDDFLISGGFNYNWTRDLEMAVSVAGGLEGPTDLEGKARISYSF